MKKIGALIFVSLLFSCGRSTPKEIKAGNNSLKKGEKFVVILSETHRDGATWHLSDTYDKQKIGRIKEVWHGPEKGIYYYLEAQQTGQTELHFAKRKYTDTLDNVTFILNITE